MTLQTFLYSAVAPFVLFGQFYFASRREWLLWSVCFSIWLFMVFTV